MLFSARFWDAAWGSVFIQPKDRYKDQDVWVAISVSVHSKRVQWGWSQDSMQDSLVLINKLHFVHRNIVMLECLGFLIQVKKIIPTFLTIICL